MIKFLRKLFGRTYKVGKHHEKQTISNNWRDNASTIYFQRYM